MTSFAVRVTLVLAILFAAGCDDTKLVADSTSGMFQRAQPAFEQYWDYDTAGKALPANIVQLEGILRIVPDNKVIVLQGIQAYVGYGYGWIEDRVEDADAVDNYEEADHLRARANKMYLRAKDLGEHLARLEGGDDLDAILATGQLDIFTKWLKDTYQDKADAIPLLWWGQAWASYINMAMEDMDVVADVPLVKALLKHSVDLDPEYFFSTGKMALGIVWASQLPPDMELSKKYFDESLEATERRSLITQVNMARYYAVSMGDSKLFRELLEEVLNAGDVLPEARLTNRIARRRAERYLRLIDQYFSDIE